MSVQSALERADAVLRRQVPLPAHLRVITAAHLARCALEQEVAATLESHGRPLPAATARSRLIVLRVLHPMAGAHAGVAWDGLSRACHRHAFELPPAEAEVRALLDHVRAVGSPHG